MFSFRYHELYEEGTIDKDTYYKIVSTVDLAKEYIPAILIVFITAGCVTLAKHLMLMFGVLAKKRFFMLPWLVITMAGLVSNVFFGVGYSVIYATNYRYVPYIFYLQKYEMHVDYDQFDSSIPVYI